MKKIIYGLLAFGPVLALAQDVFTVKGNLIDTGKGITSLITGTVIPVLFAVALVYFIYGVVKFIMAAGVPEDRAKAQGIMIWGIVGLVVIVGVYGLIAFLQNATGINGVNAPSLPGGGTL